VIAAESKPTDPRRSPSYPQRVHIRERAQWQNVLDRWDQRVETARATYAQRSGRSDGLELGRLFAQMLGARDQIADAVKRLPIEVGDLYEEDRHRLDEAVAALERLFARWDAATRV
jgi:hypothetical protein